MRKKTCPYDSTSIPTKVMSTKAIKQPTIHLVLVDDLGLADSSGGAATAPS